jgi:hypothetical protein
LGSSSARYEFNGAAIARRTDFPQQGFVHTVGLKIANGLLSTQPALSKRGAYSIDNISKG